MRSLIAALRSLTLPNGATTGQRIVIDADNGVVLVYDVNNNLIASLTPSDNGTQWLAGITTYFYNGILGNYVKLFNGMIRFGTWNNENPAFTSDGFIQCDDSGQTNPVTLRIIAPTYDVNAHTAEIDMLSAPGPGGNGARPFVSVSDGAGSNPGLCDGQISGYWYCNNPTDVFHQAREKWHPFGLLNGWVQDGNSDTFSYKVDALGFVHFKGGLLAGTTADGTQIATVPVGWRPAKDVLQLVTRSSATQAARLQISATTGAVEVFDVGTASGLHFDQVCYANSDQQ